MSFEEPKAPIVRIRKKRTKKKSKENQIVHLPVRASRQTRYSSLTTPTNPQLTGRECCRRFMASCFKIPICKQVCFGCILPPCYDGEKGSDDEVHEIKDEGYHSQVRGSTEVPTMAVAGAAQGSSEPGTSDATELKTETIALIPPPRKAGNDYRQDPCCSTDSSHSAGTGADRVVYIEVETVNLSDRRSAEVSDEDAETSMKDFVARNASDTEHPGDMEFVEMHDMAGTTDYEVPVSMAQETSACDHLSNDLNGKVVYSTIVSNSNVYTNEKYIKCDGDISEYVECDNNQETPHYANMDVLKYDEKDVTVNGSSTEENTDYLKVNVLTVNKGDQDLNKPHDYANLSSLKGLEAESDRICNSVNESSNATEIVNHDYINLSSLNGCSQTNEPGDNIQTPAGYSDGVNDSEPVTRDIIKMNSEQTGVGSATGDLVSAGSDIFRIINGSNGDNNCSPKLPDSGISNATTDADSCTEGNGLDMSETQSCNMDKKTLLIKTSKKSSKRDNKVDEDNIRANDHVTDQTKLI